jgi:hypothetical protein
MQASKAALLMTDSSTLDTLKGIALVATFVGFLVTCAALVSLWDTTWREAVSPVRMQVYSPRPILDNSACLFRTQLPSLVDQPPQGSEWISGVKVAGQLVEVDQSSGPAHRAMDIARAADC